MSEPITYVLLIRHGENDWVGQNRLAGRTPGVHLNETGRDQSDSVALALSEQQISAVYSSPMERCLETARVLAKRCGLEVQEEAGVIEVDYGQWQGGSIKELAKTPEWQMVQHAPSSFRFPEGETLFEVQARAVAAIDRIRKLHPDQIVAIYSHGDVIRTAVAHYLGIPFDLFQRVLIGTASITAIAFYGAIPRVLFTNYATRIPKFEFPKEEEQHTTENDEPKQQEES